MGKIAKAGGKTSFPDISDRDIKSIKQNAWADMHLKSQEDGFDVNSMTDMPH